MIQPTTLSIGGKFCQLLCTAASVLAICLVAFPSIAHAVGADGTYRVTGGKGSFSSGGETRKIPPAVFNKITKGQSAAMVVRDQKLKINRNLAASFFQSLAQDQGITVRPKVTGPSFITLMPVGNDFTGKTSSPIVAKLSGSDDGEKFSVIVKTNVSAVVKGDTLTLTTRFIATDGSDKITGVITLVGVRPSLGR